MHFCWTWGIGLPSTAYADSQWAITSTANITTNNGTHLLSPSDTNSPGNEKNCQFSGTDTIQTFAFPNGTMTGGWCIWQYENDTGFTNNSGVHIMQLWNAGTTVRVRVKPTSTATTSTLQVLVNGTVVGTTSGVYGDNPMVLAVDFDLTTTPPKAGLVVNGVREIALTAGTGSSTNVDRVQFGGGSGSGFAWLGDFALFNDRNDLTDAQTQDVWVAFFDPDAVTDGDASWTPSAGTDITAINDGSSTTYTASSTDPDDLVIGFESTTDVKATWFPTTIYGVAVVAYGTGSVITDTDLTVTDANGSFSAVNDTFNPIGRFIGKWAPLASDGSAWSAFLVNSISATYAVST